MREALFVAAAGAAMSLACTAPASAQGYGDDNWSGFYVGANAGGAWGDTNTHNQANPGNGPIVVPPADLARIAAHSDSNNKTGFTGGVEGGYNYVSGSLLFGLETDYGFFDIGQSKTLSFTSGLLINPPITETLSQKISTDWLWTLRPRIGYVSGPWMVYLTGGLAVSKIKYRVSFSDTRIPPDSVSQSFGDTKTGWTAGVGGAMALNPQWSVKAEYLYTDLGNIRGSLATPTGFVNLTSQVDITANIFRAGVDFRF